VANFQIFNIAKIGYVLRVILNQALLQKGGISIAHIADDIQKQSKAFYLQYI
jgi:hypothetical protein